MISKCLFPAAGYGTRFLPATKSVPKEMLPILTKPLLQYAVEEALAANLENMAIVTGRGKRAIEDHFDNSFELESHFDSAGDTTTSGPGETSDVTHQAEIDAKCNACEQCKTKAKGGVSEKESACVNECSVPDMAPLRVCQEMNVVNS